jgi:hypothetical protein
VDAVENEKQFQFKEKKKVEAFSCFDQVRLIFRSSSYFQFLVEGLLFYVDNNTVMHVIFVFLCVCSFYFQSLVLPIVDGIACFGIFVLAVAYTFYNVVLRCRGSKVGAVTTWVSVALFSASVCYLLPFVLELQLTSYVWFFYLGALLEVVLQLVFLFACFVVASGVHVVTSQISGQARCRFITLGVLAGAFVIIPVIVTILMITWPRHPSGPFGDLAIVFLVAVVTLAVAIVFSICYIIFFFAAVRETTSVLDSMTLSPERRALLMRKYRTFKIGGVIFASVCFAFYFGSVLCWIFVSGGPRFELLFEVVRVLGVFNSVVFSVFMIIVFCPTATESLDAREECFWSGEFGNFAEVIDI